MSVCFIVLGILVCCCLIVFGCLCCGIVCSVVCRWLCCVCSWFFVLVVVVLGIFGLVVLC